MNELYLQHHPLYDEIMVDTNEMLSIYKLPPITNGRKIQFSSSTPIIKLDYYTWIDKIIAPFENFKLQSNIKYWEKLLSQPHDMLLLVVNKEVFKLPSIQLKFNHFPTVYSHSEVGSIQLQATLNASVRCCNPKKMIDDYESGNFSNWMDKIVNELKTVAYHIISHEIHQILIESSPMHALSRINDSQIKIQKKIKYDFEQGINWVDLHHLEVELQILNYEEIEEKTNTPYTLTVDTKKKLVDMIINTFGNHTFPQEFAQIIVAFIQSNPSCSQSDLQDLLTQLHQLLNYYSPKVILSEFKNMELLDFKQRGE